jgi:hypothetical protein
MWERRMGGQKQMILFMLIILIQYLFVYTISMKIHIQLTSIKNTSSELNHFLNYPSKRKEN